jgi:hypothetical protein
MNTDVTQGIDWSPSIRRWTLRPQLYVRWQPNDTRNLVRFCTFLITRALATTYRLARTLVLGGHSNGRTHWPDLFPASCASSLRTTFTGERRYCAQLERFTKSWHTHVALWLIPPDAVFDKPDHCRRDLREHVRTAQNQRISTSLPMIAKMVMVGRRDLTA